ncbi:MAG: SDR family NAD(P)-dependent oxidoreductase [Gaiellaceae bacterium]
MLAVVSGASSGIGEATARRLTAGGWQCVLLARREERLRSLAQELGGEYELCDVSDRAAVEAVAARVLERHPAIDLLVNNAGMPARTDFLAGDPARIEQVMRTNYLGSVWCLRAFLPALAAAAPSHVVNVVSVAGTISLGSSGPYAASKHAQLAFSRSVGLELRVRRISVHTVNPGFVETEGFPQRDVLSNPLLRRVVIGADDVAAHILRVLEKGPSETVVPRWYRVAGIAQALAPNLLARMLSRGVKP